MIARKFISYYETLISSFESCWPAITRGSHAAILVLNVDDMPEESDAEHWLAKPFHDFNNRLKCFIKDAGLKVSQVLVLVNKCVFLSQAAPSVPLR